MSIDYVALKAELDAGHPVTGAYNADDQLAADELNLANIVVEREVTGLACQEATDSDEFNGLSDGDHQLWATICGWESVNFNLGFAGAVITGMWAGPQGVLTRTNLEVLKNQAVNRTSQLNFGRETLDESQVRHARKV